MQLIQLYQNPQKTTALYVPEEDEFITVQLTGNVDHENYKALFEKLYQYVGLYKYRNIVYDLKALTSTEEHSRTWFVTSFLPRVIKNMGTGFKTAVIRPENEFENASLAFLVQLSRSLGFTNSIYFFASRAQAIEWILDKRTPSLNADEVRG